MKTLPPAGITLPQFTAASVPFGIFAVSTLLWPETTQALDLERTKATIWATSILLIPALVLYPFRTLSARIANFAYLCWTFAYLLFLLHAYWAVFVIFDGIADTFKQMGAAIAGVNFLLVLWWGIDVVLLWIVRSGTSRMARFQWATRVFAFLVFAITLTVLRGGSVRTLGFVFIAAVAVALVVRFWVRARPDESYA
jgi:hypothetical protein